MKENILETYMNYLYALRMREEYGDLFGDTDDIIEYFEMEIKKHLLSNNDLNYNNKINDNSVKIKKIK